MFKFLFMPDGETGGMGGESAPAADTSNTGSDAPSDDDSAGEGTTPEEVAQVLKGAGMDVKVDAPAADEDDAPADEDTPVNPDEVPNAPGKEEDPSKPDLPQPEKPAPSPLDDNPETPDFSFEVEDKEGVTFKITPGDTIEDVLAEFEPKNNGQIIQILDQLRDAKDQKAQYEADQAKQAEEVAQTDRVNSIREGWDKEIQTLQADGRIPTTADGKANDRVNAVYKYMGEENQKRIDDGRPTIQSFEDALDKLENKEARDAKAEAQKVDKDRSRKNGALVGGSSAPATSGAPVYRAGSARNSGEAIRALGLL